MIDRKEEGRTDRQRGRREERNKGAKERRCVQKKKKTAGEYLLHLNIVCCGGSSTFKEGAKEG